MAIVVGVDGTPAGWVAVVLDGGCVVDVQLHATFRDLIAEVPEATVFGIDIPIGLPRQGVRPADLEARRFLGRRASTIFITPPRDVLTAETYDEANRLCRELSGNGLSRQAYALLPKIRDVTSVGDPRAYEVHPEVSFARIAGAPLMSKKHSWDGAMQRRRLLVEVGIVLPDDLGAAGRSAGVDDVLDAAVAAWSANRIGTGDALSLPENPSDDLDAAIWS